MESQPGSQLFPSPVYVLRRKALRIFGGSFTFYEPGGRPVLYADMKAFKLREDIRLYSNAARTNEILTIKARNIIDWAGGTYDVFDASTQQLIGSLKRSGLKSAFVRDQWTLLTPAGDPFGTLSEDSTILGLIRRYLIDLIPQSFTVDVNGQLVAHFRQRFNPFILKIELDFRPDIKGLLDRRLGIAAALLMSAIEGRQG